MVILLTNLSWNTSSLSVSSWIFRDESESGTRPKKKKKWLSIAIGSKTSFKWKDKPSISAHLAGSRWSGASESDDMGGCEQEDLNSIHPGRVHPTRCNHESEIPFDIIELIRSWRHTSLSRRRWLGLDVIGPKQIQNTLRPLSAPSALSAALLWLCWDRHSDMWWWTVKPVKVGVSWWW